MYGGQVRGKFPGEFPEVVLTGVLPQRLMRSGPHTFPSMDYEGGGPVAQGRGRGITMRPVKQ